MSKLTLYSCNSRERITGLHIFTISTNDDDNTLLKNSKFKKIGNLTTKIMKKVLRTHQFGVVCKFNAKQKIKFFFCELSPKDLRSKLSQYKKIEKKLMK